MVKEDPRFVTMSLIPPLRFLKKNKAGHFIPLIKWLIEIKKPSFFSPTQKATDEIMQKEENV
jgi:hypothetical protein